MTLLEKIVKNVHSAFSSHTFLFLISGLPVPENIPGWNPATRTLRNITNNSDMQPASRPVNVGHVRNQNGSLFPYSSFPLFCQ